MIKVFEVPVQVYQAYGDYVSTTGEEVYVNDLCIADDSRAFIHSISVNEDGDLKFTPVYLIHDKHPTIMKKCEEDLAKVRDHMKSKLKEFQDE